MSDVKSFRVVIEEKVVQEFEVCASSSDEARKIAIEKYQNEEFVLEPGDVQSRSISVMNGDGDFDEWDEF